MPRFAEIKRYNALSTDRFFISAEIGGSNNVFQRECFTVERNEWSKVYFTEVAQGLGIPPAAWVRPGFRLCPFGDSWVISFGRAGAYNLTYPVKLDLNKRAQVDSSAPEAGFNSGGLTVTTRRMTDTSEYNSTLNLPMVTKQASPSYMPPASATPTQALEKLSYSGGRFNKTTPGKAASLPAVSKDRRAIKTHTMLPAVGSYFNTRKTEQLSMIRLKVSGEFQRSSVASLLIFCITTQCLQSTLPRDKPIYFYRMPSKKGKDDALVFAPPPLALRRIDDLCYHLDATDRRDRNEIAKAFNDAGGALEISNFMPASTIMCWWQDRAAGDLWLGMRIDQQGVAFPDRIVPLGYTYGAPTTYSSSTAERLPGENWQNALSYEAQHGRTKRRRSSTSRGGKNGESPSSKLPKYT